MRSIYDFGENAVVSERTRDGWMVFIARPGEGRVDNITRNWNQHFDLNTAGTTLDGSRFVWSTSGATVLISSTEASVPFSDARVAALRQAQTVVKPGISPHGWLAVDRSAAELYDTEGGRLRGFSTYQAELNIWAPMTFDLADQLIGVAGEAANLVMSSSGVELASMPSAIDDLGFVDGSGIVVVFGQREGGGISVVEANGSRPFAFEPSEPFRMAPRRWARVHPAGLALGDANGSLAFVTAAGFVCPIVKLHEPVEPERLSETGYRTVLGSCPQPGCRWRRMVIETPTDELYFITPLE